MSPDAELFNVAQLVANELGLAQASFCGKGAFKETYRAQDKSGKTVALKLVDRAKINLERTEREIAALKRCQSPRVAQVFETRVFNAPDRRIFDVVVEEFFDGGTLEERLQVGALKKKRRSSWPLACS